MGSDSQLQCEIMGVKILIWASIFGHLSPNVSLMLCTLFMLFLGW